MKLWLRILTTCTTIISLTHCAPTRFSSSQTSQLTVSGDPTASDPTHGGGEPSPSPDSWSDDSGPSSCPNPGFPASALTCVEAIRNLETYFQSFDPGRGCNNLPAEGQTSLPLSSFSRWGTTENSVSANQVILTAVDIDQASANGLYLNVRSVNSASANGIALKADRVGKVHGNPVRVLADTVQEASGGGGGLHIVARQVDWIQGANGVCAKVDNIGKIQGSYNSSEFWPRQQARGHIGTFDSRNTNSTIISNMDIDTMIVCRSRITYNNGIPSFFRINLNNSTYTHLQVEECGDGI